jgi:hypothetical protein
MILILNAPPLEGGVRGGGMNLYPMIIHYEIILFASREVTENTSKGLARMLRSFSHFPIANL